MHIFSILALIYAATVGTASGLVDAGDRTWVDVDATDYDGRDPDDDGGIPDGCVPDNTWDGSRSANSRWSCQGGGCCITYSFEEPQDIVKVRIAFHLGDERILTLDVYHNGDHHSEITSSGTSLGYETFSLDTDEAEDFKLCIDDDGDDWLSITEVHPWLYNLVDYIIADNQTCTSLIKSHPRVSFSCVDRSSEK